MPKRLHLSADDLDWLEDQLESGVSYKEMAEAIGVHVDTLKRHLMKHELADFEGAKYQPKRGHDVLMWTRACSRCGDATPRPKWQYRCDKCHEKEEDSDYASLPDDFLFDW